MNEKSVTQEVERIIFDYLASYPQNYQIVYDSLFRHGYKDVERKFIENEILQKAAQSRFFSGRLTDVARYLFGVFRVHPEKSKQMLSEFIEEYGLVSLQADLCKQSAHNFQFSLYYFFRIDNALIQKIVANIDTQSLAKIFLNDSFNNLSWMVNTMGKISPQKTADILDRISMGTLTEMASKGNIRDIERFMTHSQRFNVWSKEKILNFGNSIARFLPSLDSYNLKNLKVFGYLIEDLKDASPELSRAYKSSIVNHRSQEYQLKLLTHSSLVDIAFQKDLRIKWKDSFKLYVEDYLIDIFCKSTLKEITTFVSILKNQEDPLLPLIIQKLNQFLSDFDHKILLADLENITKFLEFAFGYCDHEVLKKVLQGCQFTK